MDAQIKAEWVKALRSGKYQQAKRALKRNGAFCCLGVLCEVVGADWDDSGDNQDIEARLNGELQSYYLTPNILREFGMTDRQQEVLYTMNDDDEKPFNEIADFIEKHL